MKTASRIRLLRAIRTANRVANFFTCRMYKIRYQSWRNHGGRSSRERTGQHSRKYPGSRRQGLLIRQNTRPWFHRTDIFNARCNLLNAGPISADDSNSCAGKYATNAHATSSAPYFGAFNQYLSGRMAIDAFQESLIMKRMQIGHDFLQRCPIRNIRASRRQSSQPDFRGRRSTALSARQSQKPYQELVLYNMPTDTLYF